MKLQTPFLRGFLVFCLCCFIAPPSLAQPSLVWTEWRSVASIDVVDGDIIFVLAGDAIASQSSCTNTFRIDKNDHAKSDWEAVLNEAFSSNRQVRVEFNSTGTGCSPLVYQVLIRRT